MNRLGWVMPSAHEIIDDNGMSWHFDLDSPAAIVRACHDSVRRWGLRRIGDQMPGLGPPESKPDVARTFKDQPTRLVDFSHILAPFINGRSKGSRKSEQWDPKWKSYLASAVTAGQWTQQRRSMVPEWHIEDKNCQLCKETVGTLEHRFHCRATTPEEGWPLPPKKAKLAVETLASNRFRILKPEGCPLAR